tara:strand:- start:1532 stop:1747 length:216 start_codon:yes stop_codon:yes gene_type:complete
MIIEICVDGGNYEEIELTDGVLSEAGDDLDLAVDFEVANYGDKLENWERIDFNYSGGGFKVHGNIENDCIR